MMPGFWYEALECRGRPPKTRTRTGSKYCYRVRSEGEGMKRTHFSEVFSVKTGRSIGYIGPFCTVVQNKKKADRKDYINKDAAAGRLYWCQYMVPPEQIRTFRKMAAEAERRSRR